MHELEGLFCKTVFSALIGKIADREKNNTGPKLTGPAVHRRGTGAAHSWASARFGGEAKAGRIWLESARWPRREEAGRGQREARGSGRLVLCSSGSRAAAASWLGGSAAAGSGQEGPWLEEEVDPAGSEAGKGADGVGEEHGDGANATRSGGVKRGSGLGGVNGRGRRPLLEEEAGLGIGSAQEEDDDEEQHCEEEHDNEADGDL